MRRSWPRTRTGRGGPDMAVVSSFRGCRQWQEPGRTGQGPPGSIAARVRPVRVHRQSVQEAHRSGLPANATARSGRPTPPSQPDRGSAPGAAGIHRRFCGAPQFVWNSAFAVPRDGGGSTAASNDLILAEKQKSAIPEDYGQRIRPGRGMNIGDGRAAPGNGTAPPKITTLNR